MKNALAIILLATLTACAAEPPRNFYHQQSQYVTGWQDASGKIHLVGVTSSDKPKDVTITATRSKLRPLGWAPAGADVWER